MCMWLLSWPITMQWTASPCENMISSWGSWGLPGGWIPLGHAWCPPGTSLSSWLDFRGVPLSRWTQSSYNSRQRSWPHSLPSRGSGTSKPFWWEKCLVFGPAYSHVVLRPRPGYVIKVPSTPFRDQVVNLQALPSEEADPALALLCPVRTLRVYVDRTRSFRSSEQLFVCHRGQQKGKAVSKLRLAHWIVDAIVLVYQSQGEPCPLGMRAHSTPTHWRTAPLWQTSVELWAGRHRTPSRDSTVSALSQFLPVWWVTGNGREELAGVTLAAPFPLIRGCKHLFSPPV